MPIIDFRLRPPLKGYLDLVMYSKAERRDRLTRHAQQGGADPCTRTH
jgi:hypothetical protein